MHDTFHHGDWLTAWRKRLGLTIAEAAEALGIAPSTYCAHAISDKALPRRLLLAALAVEHGLQPVPAGAMETWRLRVGMTLDEVASALNASMSTVSKYMDGNTPTIARLAAAAIEARLIDIKPARRRRAWVWQRADGRQQQQGQETDTMIAAIERQHLEMLATTDLDAAVAIAGWQFCAHRLVQLRQDAGAWKRHHEVENALDWHEAADWLDIEWARTIPEEVGRDGVLYGLPVAIENGSAVIAYDAFGDVEPVAALEMESERRAYDLVSGYAGALAELRRSSPRAVGEIARLARAWPQRLRAIVDRVAPETDGSLAVRRAAALQEVLDLTAGLDAGLSDLAVAA